MVGLVGQLLHEQGEVVAGELPFEGGGRLLVASLEGVVPGTVIPGGDLAAALRALDAEPTPRVRAGIRATPGLTVAVEPAGPGLIRLIAEEAVPVMLIPGL